MSSQQKLFRNYLGKICHLNFNKLILPELILSQLFKVNSFGPGSGLVELGGSEPLPSLLSLPESPKLDVNKKIAISKNLRQKYLKQKILAELFSKKCHLILNN